MTNRQKVWTWASEWQIFGRLPAYQCPNCHNAISSMRCPVCDNRITPDERENIIKQADKRDHPVFTN